MSPRLHPDHTPASGSASQHHDASVLQRGGPLHGQESILQSSTSATRFCMVFPDDPCQDPGPGATEKDLRDCHLPVGQLRPRGASDLPTKSAHIINLDQDAGLGIPFHQQPLLHLPASQKAFTRHLLHKRAKKQPRGFWSTFSRLSICVHVYFLHSPSLHFINLWFQK